MMKLKDKKPENKVYENDNPGFNMNNYNRFELKYAKFFDTIFK